MIVLVVLALIVGAALAIPKAGANARGENLCAYCRKRLKYAGAGRYAGTCPRCGKGQPE